MKKHLLPVSLMTIICFLLWKDYVLNISKVVFSGGDSVKSIFAIIDYVLYGKGLHIYGLNYPYGEHCFFSDNQLPFAALLKFIHHNLFSLEGQLISIINAWHLIQIPLAVISLYFLLTRFFKNIWWAFLGALLIGFLSPQLDRIIAHFSLGYVFVYIIFFTLVFDIFYKNPKHLRQYIYLIALLVFAGLSHLYLLFAICLFYCFFLCITLALKSKKIKQHLYTILSFIISIIPIYYIVIHLDPFDARAKYGIGLRSYLGTFEGMFYPRQGFVADWFNGLFNNALYKPNGESVNFLGFATIFLGLVFLILFLRKKIKLKQQKTILVFFISGLLCWVYSLGFIYDILPDIVLNKLAFITQIRSLGRLGILWYYSFGILSFAVLVYLLQHKIKWIKGVGLFFCCLWLVESFAFQKSLQREGKITLGENLFTQPKANFKSILKKHQYTLNDFQCSLVLPIAQAGVLHNFNQAHFYNIHFGGRLYLETAIPTIGNNYTRGSEEHAQNALQLLGTHPTKKERLESMNDKKVLLLYSSNIDFQKEQKKLIDQSTQIDSIDDMHIAVLDINDFNAIIDSITPKENLLIKSNTITTKTRFKKDDRYVLSKFSIKKALESKSDFYTFRYSAYFGPEVHRNEYRWAILDSIGNKLHEEWLYIHEVFNNKDFYSIQKRIIEKERFQNATFIEISSDFNDGEVKDISLYPNKE